MVWKSTFRYVWRANMATWYSSPPNNDIERMRSRGGWKRQESKPLGIVQLVIQPKPCSWEITKNILLKQRSEREMDAGICWQRNLWSKKASWRHRGSGSARAGWYAEWYKCGIDEQRARIDFPGDHCCYHRESEWSCKFRRCGWCGRWRRRRDRAGQVEWRRQTWLADGYKYQNGTAPHVAVSVEGDEPWWIDTTGMGQRSWLLQGKR